MKHNHLLNHYQLQVLERGIEMEKAGVQVHSYPRNETEALLIQYYQYVYDGIKCDIEIVIGALSTLYDFWACYFAAGADTAFYIKALQDDLRMKAIQQNIDNWQKSQDEKLEAEIARWGN